MRGVGFFVTIFDMERTFSIKYESQTSSQEGERSYAVRVLEIINGMRKKVLAPDMHPQGLLHKAVHKDAIFDSRAEVKSMEVVREDILDTFQVPNDSEHVYIQERDGSSDNNKSQRVVRAFYILLDLTIDDGRGTVYYAEGRTAHASLLNTIVNRFDVGINIEELFDSITEDSPRFLVFKGFLDNDDFSSLSDNVRAELEERILDSDGNSVITPSNWFVTGSNIATSHSEENE